jgi:SRSO17 transposase
MDTCEPASDLFDPDRWGLPADAVASLAERLQALWTRFRPCFTTTTRDASPYAWVYLRGVLTMTSKRTFANIARRVIAPTDDGQALQQFMSDSPWSAQSVIAQVQSELAASPTLHPGGMLILDESADAKAGLHSAGAARQWNGRLGKVDLCQVGVFLAFATETLWTWIDGELFLPEPWFAPNLADERTRLGIPPTRPFATKVELGWQMLERVLASGVPFEVLLCDDLYGRSQWLRQQLRTAKVLYLADVPADTKVYLRQPVVGVPVARGRKGRPPTLRRVLNGVPPVEVEQVGSRADTHFGRVQVRETERGVLEDAFAVRQVWTLSDGEVVAEWLVIRQEGGEPTYALSNAPTTTPAAQLVEWKCRRFGIECANHDAKSELGWGDFQAQKYVAWEHHLALTILAGWFVAQTKADWARQYVRDDTLAEELGIERLPALSVANVRELLQAVMPLEQLSPGQARHLVVKHLVNRSRSTLSRLKAQRRERGPT